MDHFLGSSFLILYKASKTTNILFATIFVLLKISVFGQIAQINVANYPTGFESRNDIPKLAAGKLFYASDNLTLGNELVAADLNLTSAYVVRNIRQGSNGSFPSSITALGDKVVFTADNGQTGRELYASDGTEAGTSQILDLAPGSADGFDLNVKTFVFEGFVLTYGKDRKIIATDGTDPGTKIALLGASNCYIYAIAGQAYLAQDNLLVPDTLYKYEYSTNTKTVVTSIENIQNSGFYIYSFPNTLSFGNQFLIGLNSQILVSDGTPQGSFIANSVNGQPFGNSDLFVQVDGKVYFRATTSAHGSEIFVLDIQSQSIQIAANVNTKSNGTASSAPSNLVCFNDSVFFIATDGELGLQLYKVKDTNFSLVPNPFIGINGFQSSGMILDTIQGKLIISKATSNGASFIYKNGVTISSPARYNSMDGNIETPKTSAIYTVPGTNLKFLTLRSTTGGADTLVQYAQDGSEKKFVSGTLNFYSVTNMKGLDVGDRIYFRSLSGSGLYTYIWWIDKNDLTPVDQKVTSSSDVIFFPNPVSSQSIFYRGLKTMEDIKLFDAFGRVIHQVALLSPAQEFSIGKLPNGIYFIKSGNGSSSSTQRLVVMR